MFPTVEGVYKRGSIKLVETPVGLEEAHILVTFLPPAKAIPQPQVLYGVWQDRMAVIQDVDAVLNEIRDEWESGQSTSLVSDKP